MSGTWSASLWQGTMTAARGLGTGSGGLAVEPPVPRSSNHQKKKAPATHTPAMTNG